MIIDHRDLRRPARPAAGIHRSLREDGALGVQRISNLVGYFVTDIDRLNQVVHLWAYDSLDDRDDRRSRMEGSRLEGLQDGQCRDLPEPGKQDPEARISPIK